MKKLFLTDLKMVSGGMRVIPDDLGFTIILEDKDYENIEKFYTDRNREFSEERDLENILEKIYIRGYERDWDLKVLGLKRWDNKSTEYETKATLYNALGKEVYIEIV